MKCICKCLKNNFLGKVRELKVNTKIEELKELLSEYTHGKKEEEKKANPVVIVLAILGAIAAVAAIAYAVYYFFVPEDSEDFEDFEDEELEDEDLEEE